MGIQSCFLWTLLLFNFGEFVICNNLNIVLHSYDFPVFSEEIVQFYNLCTCANAVKSWRNGFFFFEESRQRSEATKAWAAIGVL